MVASVSGTCDTQGASDADPLQRRPDLALQTRPHCKLAECEGAVDCCDELNSKGVVWTIRLRRIPLELVGELDQLVTIRTVRGAGFDAVKVASGV
jgi:hypothetical protein